MPSFQLPELAALEDETACSWSIINCLGDYSVLKRGFVVKGYVVDDDPASSCGQTPYVVGHLALGSSHHGPHLRRNRVTL